jgi:spore germination protein KC
MEADNQNSGANKNGDEHSADDAEYKAGELPRSGGLAREIFGCAVFDGAKMVGELTGEETRILLMVRDEFKKSDFAIQDPIDKKKLIVMNVVTSRPPEFEANTNSVKPLIYVKIFLEGKYYEIQSGIDYERPEMKKLVEKAFEEETKNRLDKLIKKCQTEFHSDVFGFGRAAIKHFLTIEEWEKYNWLGAFTKAEVTTEISFAIRRTGTLMKSEKARSAKGKE